LALDQQISKILQNPKHFIKQIFLPKIPTKLTFFQIKIKALPQNKFIFETRGIFLLKLISGLIFV